MRKFYLGLLCYLLLGGPSFATVSLRLESGTSASGETTSVHLYLDDGADLPTALVVQLEFDVTQLTLCGVEQGGMSGDSTLGFRSTETGAVLVIFGPTPLGEGRLATLCIEVNPSATPERAVTISNGESSASTASAEALLLDLPDSAILVEGAVVPPHHADLNGDMRLTLTEVLRVIQLYSADSFYCDTASDDGFSLAGDDRSCPPHDLDYAPQDWAIDLAELLRCIQFFNAPNNAYHRDPTSEDGFFPGPKPIP